LADVYFRNLLGMMILVFFLRSMCECRSNLSVIFLRATPCYSVLLRSTPC
jgi:hypothetical protein